MFLIRIKSNIKNLGILQKEFFVISIKIALKRGFCIKKFQACKRGEICVGVDDTLLYHQNTYDLFLCCKVI